MYALCLFSARSKKPQIVFYFFPFQVSISLFMHDWERGAIALKPKQKPILMSFIFSNEFPAFSRTHNLNLVRAKQRRRCMYTAVSQMPGWMVWEILIFVRRIFTQPTQ